MYYFRKNELHSCHPPTTIKIAKKRKFKMDINQNIARATKPQPLAKSNLFIKSPLNYIGGKYKILSQILPLFPNNISCFFDLFAGGCNVGINVTADTVIFNDNLTYLIELYKELQNKSTSYILNHIHTQINSFSLSKSNETGYKKFRSHYNKKKKPLDLLILISYSFNHQIRFNNNHDFNNPFGKNRSQYNQNIEKNLINFTKKIQQNKIKFKSTSFELFNFDLIDSNSFVYCDPPYLITTGTYNDGKRGFTGWSENEELKLLNILDNLNYKNIKFALSNVLEHKGKSNDLLKSWLKKNTEYKVNYLNNNYANSNYQILNKKERSSEEVLITNYL